VLIPVAEVNTNYAGIEAIDGFLAQQLCHSLGSENALVQHLFIALSEALRNGHSCVPLEQLAEMTRWSSANIAEQECAGYRFPELSEIKQALCALDIAPEHNAPVVLQQEALYLRRYWHYEQHVAQQLLMRMQPQALTQAQEASTQALLSELFARPDDGTVDWQARAVKDALSQQVSVISGGPGTGKTYTVARLLVAQQAAWQANSDVPITIAMAAPTGKAKQRLLESITQAKQQLLGQGIAADLIDAIPNQAHTLHGLLGIRPNSQSVRHHSDNPLAIDLLLVDEVSMVDLPMMAKLLAAIPSHCKLVLVGDAEQLPSVAAGSILADIPASKISYLHKSHRFDGQGGIGILANLVMKNQSQESWLLLNQAQDSTGSNAGSQLSLVSQDGYNEWLEQVCNTYYLPMLKAASLGEAFECLARFRILAATRQGEQGVEGINHQVEQILSRKAANVRIGKSWQSATQVSPVITTHYHGKPVMVTKNHHGLQLFNGDIGIIWADQSGQLMVCFQQAGGVVKVNVGLLQDLDTVYAMTIHKTQGSEFEHVGLVIAPQAERLLSSQLLYTAITRAKSQCSIYTNGAVWQRAVSSKALRWSGLKGLLAD